MEDERDAFLRAIEDHPNDPTYRYAYADWLEEHNDWKEAGRQRLLGVWPDALKGLIGGNDEARIPRIELSQHNQGWLPKLKDIWFPFELTLATYFTWKEKESPLLPANPKMIGLNLIAPLHSALFNQLLRCTQIEYLDLNCDQLQRNGIPQLTVLNRLKGLVISNFKKNKSAEFECLESFPNLESMTFRNCNLLTSTALKGLTKLSPFQSLRIEECPEISREGLNHLSELTQISQLSFSHNKLPTKIFHAISHLNQLELFSCPNCSEVTDNSIRQLTPLRNLRQLTTCGLNDQALFWIGQFSKLRYLDISGSSITDQGFEHLRGLDRLEVLNLQGTKITDVGFSALENFDQLEKLRLTLNWNLKGSGLRYLEKKQSLRELDFDRCNFRDDEMQRFPFLPNLQTLTIQLSRLNDQMVKPLLYQVPSIREWKMSENKECDISDELFQSIPSLNQLQTFHFPWTRITDRSVDRIATISSLRELNLSNSRFLQGSTLHCLERLPRLTKLHLWGCSNLTIDSLPKLSGCQSLRELILPTLPGIDSVVNELKEALPRCKIW